jgi:hypothetical protein
MNSPAATIEHFRATRRRVLDLSVDPMVGGGCSDLPGYVYADGFFIEIEPDGSVYLPLIQREHRAPAADIAQLEVLLFVHAVECEQLDAERCHLACVRENLPCADSCPCCGGAS